jgi:hypothetical protein
MNILLIGNYPLGEQRSMHCFADLLRRMLEETGHRVTLVRPTPILGYGSATAGLGKWLGYIDRFLLFRPTLGRCAAAADLVHICDQANAVYVSLLEDRPHIVTCHDTLAIRSALNEIEENPTRWSGRVYQRRILGGLRRAQHVACVSERTRMELSRLGGVARERLSVVPNALHYPYRPMARGEASERIRRWGIPDDRRYFLHVGCNAWYKNRPGVVRIFAKLAAASRFARHDLVMVGEPWPAALRRLVQDSGLAGPGADLPVPAGRVWVADHRGPGLRLSGSGVRPPTHDRGRRRCRGANRPPGRAGRGAPDRADPHRAARRVGEQGVGERRTLFPAAHA